MDNYRLEIGTRLKKCRKEKHFTQEQLSELLGISQKHYSEAERGITGLSIGNLIELSNILSVSLDYLLKGEVLSNMSSIEDLKKVSELFYEASDATRKNMLVILQILLETERRTGK